MKLWLKYILLISLVVLFLISIPFAWQNADDYKQINNAITDSNKEIDKICSSGCTDYPSEWIIPGKELEAENYCLRQCQSKSKMKEDLAKSISSMFLFRSKTHKAVGVIYCLLGLNCLPK